MPGLPEIDHSQHQVTILLFSYTTFPYPYADFFASRGSTGPVVPVSRGTHLAVQPRAGSVRQVGNCALLFSAWCNLPGPWSRATKNSPWELNSWPSDMRVLTLLSSHISKTLQKLFLLYMKFHSDVLPIVDMCSQLCFKCI